MKRAWTWFKSEHDVPVHGWFILLVSWWVLDGLIHDLVRLAEWIQGRI